MGRGAVRCGTLRTMNICRVAAMGTLLRTTLRSHVKWFAYGRKKPEISFAPPFGSRALVNPIADSINARVASAEIVSRDGTALPLTLPESIHTSNRFASSESLDEHRFLWVIRRTIRSKNVVKPDIGFCGVSLFPGIPRVDRL